MSDDTQLVPTRKLSAAGKKGGTPDTEKKNLRVTVIGRKVFSVLLKLLSQKRREVYFTIELHVHFQRLCLSF